MVLVGLCYVIVGEVFELRWEEIFVLHFAVVMIGTINLDKLNESVKGKDMRGAKIILTI
jgi:hypothetical protein